MLVRHDILIDMRNASIGVRLDLAQYEEHGSYSIDEVIDEFGDWHRAIKAAGLRPA